MIKLRRINCNWEDNIDEDEYYPGADVTGKYEKEYGHQSDEYTLLGREFTRIPSEKIPYSLKIANAIDHKTTRDDLVSEFFAIMHGIQPANYIYVGEVDIRTYGNDFLIQWKLRSEYSNQRAWREDQISKIFSYPEDLVETVVQDWLDFWKDKLGRRAGVKTCWAYLDTLAPLFKEDDDFLYRIGNTLSVDTIFDNQEVFQQAKDAIEDDRLYGNTPQIFIDALNESDLDTIWEKARALHELINKPDIKHAIYQRAGEYDDN